MHLKKYLPDWFISGLFIMIIVAWLHPGIGMTATAINLGLVIDVGVSLVFLFYGMKLNPERFIQGMSNKKMHIAVQATTFLFFPLLVLPFYPLFHHTPYEMFWLGIFFLAVLPSTVSSSVVMVSIAGGNIPGAIFNASISGIIGIVATPLWMGLFLSSGKGTLNYPDVVTGLITQIILPVVAGLFLHRFFANRVTRYKNQLAAFDKLVILLVVYESFSHSFISGIFSSVSWVAFILLFAAVAAMFFTVMRFTSFLGTKLKFNRQDRITLQFAGSKKSLVHGSVFASVLFAGVSGGGILLLPIMVYHAFQLFYISIIARKMALAPSRQPS